MQIGFGLTFVGTRLVLGFYIGYPVFFVFTPYVLANRNMYTSLQLAHFAFGVRHKKIIISRLLFLLLLVLLLVLLLILVLVLILVLALTLVLVLALTLVLVLVVVVVLVLVLLRTETFLFIVFV